MSNIFDGKKFAAEKLVALKAEVVKLKENDIKPTLASVYYTGDAGSSLYTKLKKDAAESIGITFIEYPISEKDSAQFIKIITELNSDTSVHGILVQKPSGANDFSIEEWRSIVATLSPEKDIDGLTPENLGLLSLGTPRFIPATAQAVLEILKNWKISPDGKHVVIIGASEILGRPLSMLLTDRGSTVSILHKATPNISNYTNQADILVSATGVNGIVTGEMIKTGSAVIDVGSPKGDIKTEDVKEKAAYLSPVPGGVGPVTISCLLTNLLDAIRNRKQ